MWRTCTWKSALSHKRSSTCCVCQDPAGKPAAGATCEHAREMALLTKYVGAYRPEQAGPGVRPPLPRQLTQGECPVHFFMCTETLIGLCAVRWRRAGAASAKAAAKAPAQAEGASTLARCLCDPPPGRPMGPARQGEAAGALTLARCLCDPPPGRPMGATCRGAGICLQKRTREKPGTPSCHWRPPCWCIPSSLPLPTRPNPCSQRLRCCAAGKRLAPAGGYPVAPVVPPAEGMAAFAFDTPSPDDRVLAARRGGGAQQPRNSNAALPATAGMQALRVSDPPAARAEPATPPAAAAAVQGAGDRGGETTGLRPGLGPGPLAEPGADAAAPAPQRSRPAAEYVLEPDLARECAAAGAAEAAGERGAKPQLHLVVLGHVDAGKSTLMGRLLHDLGCAPCGFWPCGACPARAWWPKVQVRPVVPGHGMCAQRPPGVPAA